MIGLFLSERGEVLNDHYKLLPIDLRDEKQLDTIMSLAQMDPRYVMKYSIAVITEISSTELKPVFEKS